MSWLQGKVCVVTGATGMAADAARRFAQEGATVWVIDRDPDHCQALGLPYAVADLREEAATEAAFAAVRRACGRIDALYAVAGAGGRRLGDGPVHRLSLQAWDGTLALNATPAFLAARVNALAPSLVGTPMSVRAAADAASVAFAERRQPLAGGFLDPADVTQAAVYLCSDESRAVTGQVLTVDGGWTVT